jgi:membrane associated rhomboid family serine protease
MFKSIFDDIKYSFLSGNMIIRLVILNVTVFVITALIQAFTPNFYGELLYYIALPGDPMLVLFRPWTLVTHMFLHSGLWHLLWNMLVLYWFGNIAGDLLGDKKILTIYLLGGLIGAASYLVTYQLSPSFGAIALGASAAIMSIVFAAVATAPDYIMRLVLLGDVRIKFIGLAILFLDIIGTRSQINSGGHIAHLGGALFGLFFVYLLRKGIDLSSYFNKMIAFFTFKRKETPRRNKNLKVAHRASSIERQTPSPRSSNTQSQVDQILEKIKQKGYESLSPAEKEVLYQASKN